MPVARIITNTPAESEELRRQLIAAGYSVKFAAPDEDMLDSDPFAARKFTAGEFLRFEARAFDLLLGRNPAVSYAVLHPSGDLFFDLSAFSVAPERGLSMSGPSLLLDFPSPDVGLSVRIAETLPPARCATPECPSSRGSEWQ